MAKLINAKCPNCGAVLELPENLDRAFCMHCGGKVIIAKDVHYHGGKPAIACPECEGRGIMKCGMATDTKVGEALLNINRNKNGFKEQSKSINLSKYNRLAAISCNGSGKCKLSGYLMEGELSRWYSRALNEAEVHNRDTSSLVCDNGKCSRCNGTGKISKLFSMIKCELCNGTGKCRFCKGTGKCIFCKGEGKIKCKTCNGTGFKVYDRD